MPEIQDHAPLIAQLEKNKKNPERLVDDAQEGYEDDAQLSSKDMEEALSLLKTIAQDRLPDDVFTKKIQDAGLAEIKNAYDQKQEFQITKEKEMKIKKSLVDFIDFVLRDPSFAPEKKTLDAYEKYNSFYEKSNQLGQDLSTDEQETEYKNALAGAKKEAQKYLLVGNQMSENGKEIFKSKTFTEKLLLEMSDNEEVLAVYLPEYLRTYAQPNTKDFIKDFIVESDIDLRKYFPAQKFPEWQIILEVKQQNPEYLESAIALSENLMLSFLISKDSFLTLSSHYGDNVLRTLFLDIAKYNITEQELRSGISEEIIADPSSQKKAETLLLWSEISGYLPSFNAEKISKGVRTYYDSFKEHEPKQKNILNKITSVHLAARLLLQGEPTPTLSARATEIFIDSEKNADQFFQVLKEEPIENQKKLIQIVSASLEGFPENKKNGFLDAEARFFLEEKNLSQNEFLLSEIETSPSGKKLSEKIFQNLKETGELKELYLLLTKAPKFSQYLHIDPLSKDLKEAAELVEKDMSYNIDMKKARVEMPNGKRVFREFTPIIFTEYKRHELANGVYKKDADIEMWNNDFNAMKRELESHGYSEVVPSDIQKTDGIESVITMKKEFPDGRVNMHDVFLYRAKKEEDCSTIFKKFAEETIVDKNGNTKAKYSKAGISGHVWATGDTYEDPNEDGKKYKGALAQDIIRPKDSDFICQPRGCYNEDTFHPLIDRFKNAPAFVIATRGHGFSAANTELCSAYTEIISKFESDGKTEVNMKDVDAEIRRRIVTREINVPYIDRSGKINGNDYVSKYEGIMIVYYNAAEGQYEKTGYVLAGDTRSGREKQRQMFNGPKQLAAFSDAMQKVVQTRI